MQQGHLAGESDLRCWLEEQLHYGPIRVEATVLRHMIVAAEHHQTEVLEYWDAWLAASRESEELALQNSQMARALWRLARELVGNEALLGLLRSPSQYVTVLALLSVAAELPAAEAIFTHIHSWLANLVIAGVRLIPLGQSAGQKLLWDLQELVEQVVEFAMSAVEEDLYACSTGLALASVQHETLYSRLYRS
ncbi:urease accessory UreF family protein [Acidithiobacillus sp. AMEEHan]|uniref:urease accessory protein UreF n=1 Tax=Acidithiobacillus sp. AMEEHan TaxID=2994951 RepID=UPI0027E3FA6F|nr:urease accessory UreF family protein [Acidithiobacillus sp. AMEEHan]